MNGDRLKQDLVQTILSQCYWNKIPQILKRHNLYMYAIDMELWTPEIEAQKKLDTLAFITDTFPVPQQIDELEQAGLSVFDLNKFYGEHQVKK